jgi:hypothetical protein
MTTPSTPHRISRRDFLKWAAVGGAAVAGGYALSEAAPWLDYGRQAEATWNPPSQGSASYTPFQKLVRYATLAANGHNTQPWKFAIAGQTIDIRPDYTRRLPVVDPVDRELWISLGCALENLLVAARAAGFAPQVIYPDATDLIRVSLAADTPQRGPLFDAIRLRQNTRSEFDGQPVEPALLEQIQALPLEPGVAARFAVTSAERETVLEYVTQGNSNQYADQAFVNELIHWLRFNQREAVQSLDGLYTRCSGNPEVPRWLGQIFVGGTKPEQQAEVDAKKLRSSPVAVVIATDGDSRTAWVRAGQVYERLALTLTSHGLKSAFLNQPIERAEIRGQFQTALGLAGSLPQLLVRFGRAAAMPRSLRRPVEAVLA